MITIHENECKSTQRALIEFCKDFPNHHQVIYSAEKQTNGIGRGTNTWHHFNGAFAASFTLEANDIPTLTSLEVAVIINQYLSSKFNIQTKLKWPNDIFYKDKKLGGIVLHNDGNKIIVGVGLNFNASGSSHFNYSSIDAEIDHKTYFDFYNFVLENRKNPQTTKELWLKNCIHLNSIVKIDYRYSGEFKGIGENGQALIEKNGEILEEYSASLFIDPA